MTSYTAQLALDRLQELAAMDDPEEAQELAIAVGIALVTHDGAAVSWNKYEARVEAEMQNLRLAYDKTRKALLEATEERGWLADQCNVLHSHMNPSPPLGITGWLEAAIFARENWGPCSCCSEPGTPARPNVDSSEWVCDCSCHPRFGEEDTMREITDPEAQSTTDPQPLADDVREALGWLDGAADMTAMSLPKEHLAVLRSAITQAATKARTDEARIAELEEALGSVEGWSRVLRETAAKLRRLPPSGFIRCDEGPAIDAHVFNEGNATILSCAVAELDEAASIIRAYVEHRTDEARIAELEVGLRTVIDEARGGCRFVRFIAFDGSYNEYPIDALIPRNAAGLLTPKTEALFEEGL